MSRLLWMYVAVFVIAGAAYVVNAIDERHVERERKGFDAVCATEVRAVVYEYGTYTGLMTAAGGRSSNVPVAELIASESVQTVELDYPTRGYHRYFAAPAGDERCLDGREETLSRFPEFAADRCVARDYAPTAVGNLATVAWQEQQPGHPGIRRLNFLLVERDTGRVVAEQVMLRQTVPLIAGATTLSCPRLGVNHSELLIYQVLLGKPSDALTVLAEAGRTLSESEMRDYGLAYTVAEPQGTLDVADDSGLPARIGADASDIFDDDAAVHGIGVFGSVDNQDVVRVNVENADNIILVLSARYSVLWEIDASESDIDHVIVLGGDPQTVTGLDANVPISNYSTSSSPEAIPRVWAWDESSASFGSLRSRVQGITGHTFESFQGERRAASFDLRFAPDREGVIETWVDEEGVINYSDRPPSN